MANDTRRNRRSTTVTKGKAREWANCPFARRSAAISPEDPRFGRLLPVDVFSPSRVLAGHFREIDPSWSRCVCRRFGHAYLCSVRITHHPDIGLEFLLGRCSWPEVVLGEAS